MRKKNWKLAAILDFGGHFEFLSLTAWHSNQNCSIDPYLQIGTENETFASIWNENKKIHMHGPPLLDVRTNIGLKVRPTINWVYYTWLHLTYRKASENILTEEITDQGRV